MKTNFKKEKVPFTQVANDVLNNKNLSLKAKGLYAYLFSKPDGWDFSSIRIKDDHTDGRKGVLSGLKELEDIGVLDRKKHADGRLEYVLKHSTQSPQKATRVSDPESPNRTQPKRHSAESGTISNKDNTSNKDKKSNIIAEAKPSAEVIPASKPIEAENLTTERARMIRDIIEAFSYINPACAKMYGNKNQRDSCADLIDIYGFEKTLFLVQKTLPKTNPKEFFPTIMTPTQLFQKWSTLEASWEKYKGINLSKYKGKTINV